MGASMAAEGAFSIYQYEQQWALSLQQGGLLRFTSAEFNASKVVPTATENRPYSIYMPPLITY